MSCNHCDTKFGLFRKELGCSNCGLLLCSKCLQQKCAIPSKGPGQYKVCRVCFNKLSKGSESNEPIIPPDRFVKRLEEMENTAASHPITVYRQKVASKSEFTGVDQEIAERLEKLKQVSYPSDPSQHSTVASSQSIDDILAQKLAVLKGEEYKNQITQFEELDSEEEVDQITKKIVAEVSLEERCPIGSSKKAEDDVDVRSSSPDLPWCVLCNNDATFKCLDCDGDLYCTSCNTEVHKNWGETDHNVIPYKPC